MFLGCQKDDDIRNVGVNKESGIATDNHQITKITFNEIKSKEALQKPLELIEKHLDINKSFSNSKPITDDSLTILTNEVVILTTDNTVAYSFLIQTPLNSYADYENLVIYQKDNEEFTYYIYSYKTFLIGGVYQDLAISIIEWDGDIIDLESLLNNADGKYQWDGNCYYEVIAGEMHLIWCFGSDNGGGNDSNGNNAVIYTDDGVRIVYMNKCDGTGQCHIIIHTDVYINNMPHTKTTISEGPCPPEIADCDNTGSTGSEDGNTDDNNSDTDDESDDGMDIEDDINTPNAGGGNNNETEQEDNEISVGSNPPPYDQQITECFSAAGILTNVSGLTHEQKKP